MPETIETLSSTLQDAKRDMNRTRTLYYNRMATYDDMAAAARRVSAILYDYSCAKMPGRKHRRVPYQALLR